MSRLFYKVSVLLLGLSILAVKLLPEHKYLSYGLLILSSIFIVFLFFNKLIRFKLSKTKLYILMVLVLVVLISTVLTYFTMSLIPPYINLSETNPTILSQEEQTFIKTIQQSVLLSYFSTSIENETLFKNIMTKINDINHKITYRILRPIIDDDEYFKLRAKYPSFVNNSILITNNSIARVVPQFHQKKDIVLGLKLISNIHKSVCIYGLSQTGSLSILVRILTDNGYTVYSIPSEHKCNTSIIYDKVITKLSDNDIKNILNANKILVFTSFTNSNRVKKLLEHLDISITTCNHSSLYAEYQDIVSKQIGAYNIQDSTVSCINHTNSFIQKDILNKVTVIASNMLDNRLIELGDNAAFILSSLDNFNKLTIIKKPPRAISPRGLNILLAILAIWIVFMF